MTQKHIELAQQIAHLYAEFPVVQSVALAGSVTAGNARPNSDIDLYVYSTAELPLEIRRQIAAARSLAPEVGNAFWEPGDEWIDTDTGIHVDVMFRSMAWLDDQLDRVLNRHEAWVGYTTCFWHNIQTSHILFDRQGHFERQKQRAEAPYPDELVRAVIAKNYPILRNTQSSYLYQIKRAAERGDVVSVNHRIAALLASYFDILFAINRQLHPGEKRLLSIAEAHCALRPPHMRRNVVSLIGAVTERPEKIVKHTNELLDELDEVLEGMKDEG